MSFSNLGLCAELLRAIKEEGYTTPTRELAAQVAQSVETYGKYLSFKSAVIFGGVGINPQISLLKKGDLKATFFY